MPYGRIADLPRFVGWLLDSYDQQNMLTWRKGSIPKNKIWVKIGGDHGKNSLKFTLQIANISNPNAGNNTAVIAVAAVRDSHDNMVRFLEGGLGDDLSALQSHCWRDKMIKVFLNGDYEFLCKMYGLLGPQGTYPCLWCLMSRRDMHLPSDDSQSRSLENLIADNSAFLKETTEKKEAAKFNNALHTPLLQIELEKVSPPYLHILLGVVLKHHKLLEDSAHTLDTEIIAGQEDQFLTDFGKDLKKYGANWKLWEELEQKIRFEQGCVVFSQTQSDIDKHTANLDMAQNALDDLTHIPLKPRSGPIASALDPALDRQNYTPSIPQ